MLERSEYPPGVPCWIDTAQPDPEAATKVTTAGGSTLAEPFDVFDAGRMGIFSDPAAAVFSAWQAKQNIGAQLVNDPGTWNFSDLNTRDAAGAIAFYGAVFGWVAGA